MADINHEVLKRQLSRKAYALFVGLIVQIAIESNHVKTAPTKIQNVA